MRPVESPESMTIRTNLCPRKGTPASTAASRPPERQNPNYQDNRPNRVHISSYMLAETRACVTALVCAGPGL